MAHRPLHPQELEGRFRREVAIADGVDHRLAPALQAGLEEGLAGTRAAHQRIHEVSATLAEALEHQTDLRLTARQQLQATIAAATGAMEALA